MATFSTGTVVTAGWLNGVDSLVNTAFGSATTAAAAATALSLGTTSTASFLGVRVGDGSITVPSIALTSATGTGFFKSATDQLGFVTSSSQFLGFSGASPLEGIRMGANGGLRWTDTANIAASTLNDLHLVRDAANTLAQRNSTNAQTFRLYNTFTDASNYARLEQSFSGTVAIWNTQAAGTGTQTGTIFRIGGSNRLGLSTSVDIYSVPLLWVTDNTNDIGGSSTTFRPRTGYFGTSLDVGNSTITLGTTAPNVSVTKASGNRSAIRVTQTGVSGWDVANVATTGVLEIAETTAGRQVAVTASSNAVNYVALTGAATGNGVTISGAGSDTNVSINYGTQASGQHNFSTGGGAQVAITHTAGSTRQVTLTGSNGGNPAVGTTAGSLNLSATTVTTTQASGDNSTKLATTAYVDGQPSKVAAITYIIDGGSSVPATGVKGDLLVPFACTINSATLQADQSGSAVVDIWKKTYTTSSPPTVANTITASALPTLSTAQSSQDATLTGWTTAIAANDMLRFNLNSVTTCTRLTLTLKVTKT